VEDGISPAGLQPFLQYVIEAIHSETESLRTTDGSTTDERARANLLTFADDIDTRLSQIERRIRQSDPRVSILLLSTLDYPYARHINVTRRLKATHGDVLTESDHESLATLLRILTILASGREYFTTLYFKRELRNLSSALLLLSLPVIVFTSYVLLAMDTGLFRKRRSRESDRDSSMSTSRSLSRFPRTCFSVRTCFACLPSRNTPSNRSTVFTLKADVGLEFDQ